MLTFGLNAILRQPLSFNQLLRVDTTPVTNLKVQKQADTIILYRHKGKFYILSKNVKGGGFLKTKYLLVIMLLLIIIIASGCSSQVKPSVTYGSLQVKANIPSELLTRLQFASTNLTLSTIRITITKDTEWNQKVIDFTSNPNPLVFDKLSRGDWTITATVKDTDGYTIYSGTSTATVLPGSTTSAQIELAFVPGDLDVNITYPADCGITAGSLTLTNLCNPAANITQNLTLNTTTNTTSTNFTHLQSTTWPIDIIFTNDAGTNVAIGSGYVDVLPGRKTTANINVAPNQGALDISITFKTTVPKAPTGLKLFFQDFTHTAVIVTWASNPEANIKGYLVYRSTGENGEKILLTHSLVTKANYTDPIPISLTTYTYWIQAFNTDNYGSSLSTPASIMPDASYYRKIAFIEGTNLSIISGDGTGKKTLVSQYSCKELSWSPDGNKLLYTANQNGSYEIFTINPDGTGKQRVFASSSNSVNPVWSPDGTKIAFVLNYSSLYVINADGSNPTFLTNASTDGLTWSPDSTKLAFCSNGGLNLINVDGSGETVLFKNLSTYESRPLWSPDGSKIAFLLTQDDKIDLYVINPDGTGLQNLSNSQEVEKDPVWAPRGSKLAFTSYRDGNYEIYTVNADGSELKNISNNDGADRYPHWSWDADKIAFVSNRDNSNSIYVMYDDGTGQAKLPNTMVYPDSTPDPLSWQPGSPWGPY